MTIVIQTTNTPTTTSGYTYLQLAQKLRAKCRVSGAGPTGVTGQTAEYQRLLDWTNEAYLDILRKHERAWMFMRKSASCQTVQGQGLYDPAVDFGLSDFGQWALMGNDTFRCYPTDTPAGEQFMGVVSYDDWRDTYNFGAFRSTFTRPLVVAAAPGFKLCAGPIPAAGYTLTGDYFVIPAAMSAATDMPLIPAQYQDAIVYRAMMFYGMSEAANEVYQEGQIEFERMMRRLQLNQLTEIGGADPLC